MNFTLNMMNVILKPMYEGELDSLEKMTDARGEIGAQWMLFGNSFDAARTYSREYIMI